MAISFDIIKKDGPENVQKTAHKLRELVLKTGLVDIKVAAIDEDWSGLKFVYRKKDRK